MTYKASFLSVLESPVGPRQALYKVAAFLGIGHFYGVPYGVVGVILAIESITPGGQFYIPM